MSLAGRLRAARPPCAAGKTRPLHRERETNEGRTGNEDWERQVPVKSNNNIRTFLKMQCSSPSGKTFPFFQVKTSINCLRKTAQDKVI